MKSYHYQQLKKYTPVVKRIASNFAFKYSWTYFEYEDFIQECYLILLENMDKIEKVSIKKLLRYRLIDIIRKHFGRKESRKNTGVGSTNLLPEFRVSDSNSIFLEAETKYFISLIPDKRLSKIFDLLIFQGFNKKEVGELLGLSQGRIVQLTKGFGREEYPAP